MSATNAFEDALLALIFNNTNTGINIGDATGLRGSSTAGNFFVSLHTAALTDASVQTTTEAAYGGPYARVSTNRATGASGWAVSAGNGIVDNVSAITFPPCTSGSETETYFGIGGSSSGAGNLYLWGALTAGLAVSNGITPSFGVGNLDITCD